MRLSGSFSEVRPSCVVLAQAKETPIKEPGCEQGRMRWRFEVLKAFTHPHRLF